MNHQASRETAKDLRDHLVAQAKGHDTHSERAEAAYLRFLERAGDDGTCAEEVRAHFARLKEAAAEPKEADATSETETGETETAGETG